MTLSMERYIPSFMARKGRLLLSRNRRISLSDIVDLKAALGCLFLLSGAPFRTYLEALLVRIITTKHFTTMKKQITKNKSTTNTIQQFNHGSGMITAHSWQHIFSQQQSNTNNNTNNNQRRNGSFNRAISKPTIKILLTIYIPTNLARHSALKTQTDVSFITLTDTILPYNLSSNRDKRRVCAAHYRTNLSVIRTDIYITMGIREPTKEKKHYLARDFISLSE